MNGLITDPWAHGRVSSGMKAFAWAIGIILFWIAPALIAWHPW